MIDAAGDLNANPSGHMLVPLQNRQFVFPAILRHQEANLVGSSLFSTNGTQLGSDVIHKTPFNPG
jgi:hypothetical protein